MGTLGPLLITLLFLIMNNITNKELNNVYNAIFMLQQQLKEVSESTPSLMDEIDDSEFQLIMQLNDTIKGLKEVGKALRDIRKYQAKGYHA